MVMKDNKLYCCLCGKEINERESNNASPFKGRCCNECNVKKVIPTRYALSRKYALLFKAPTTYSEGGIDCITHPECLELHDLQEKVDGYIEIIDLCNDYVLIINEEGHLHDLPTNVVWSKMEMSDLCVPLVGNIILMRKEQLK